jgi:hypothetical protein
MAMNNLSSNDEPRTPATKKRPYERPAFRYEQVFVTSALRCTKTPVDQHCQVGSLKVS